MMGGKGRAWPAPAAQPATGCGTLSPLPPGEAPGPRGPAGRAERFAHRPGLERAASRRVRRLGVGDLRRCGPARPRRGGPAAAGRSAAGLRLARRGAAPAHPDPGLHERAQQPGPDRALVVRAVALAHAALVPRRVARLVRAPASGDRAGSRAAARRRPRPAGARRPRARAYGRPPTARIWFGRMVGSTGPARDRRPPRRRASPPRRSRSGARSARTPVA